MAETLTLKQIRETIAGKAGLLIDALSAIYVDADTYTIDKLADLTPDPFRMRDTYLYKPSAATTAAYSPVATVNGAHTAAVTVLAYTSTGDPVTAGDVIVVNGLEKMLVELVDTTTNTLTVRRGYDGTTAVSYVGGETIVRGAGPEFRRITKFNYPTANTVDLARAFTFNASFVGQIYFLINPDRLNTAIGEALQNPQLRTIERTAITFINNQNEYALPVGVHSKTQILGVYLRDASSADVSEASMPAWKLIEDDNAVTLHIITLPTFDSNVGFVVVWRKFFAALGHDAAATTCPRELVIPQAEVEMYKQIIKTHGSVAKQTFMQDLVLAEKALQEHIATVIAPAEVREYHIDEPVYLPAVLPRGWSWS